VSENSVEKRPIPMFWGQGEGARARAEAPWTQSGLTLCLCKPLPLVGAFSQGFKMEIPADGVISTAVRTTCLLLATDAIKVNHAYLSLST